MVLVSQNLPQGPVAQPVDPSEVSTAVKKFAGVFTGQRQILGHSAKKLHHLGKMIIVLVIIFTFARFK